jgi:hypothetical protein
MKKFLIMLSIVVSNFSLAGEQSFKNISNLRCDSVDERSCIKLSIIEIMSFVRECQDYYSAIPSSRVEQVNAYKRVDEVINKGMNSWVVYLLKDKDIHSAFESEDIKILRPSIRDYLARLSNVEVDTECSSRFSKIVNNSTNLNSDMFVGNKSKIKPDWILNYR